MSDKPQSDVKLDFLRKILKTYTPSGQESKLSGFYRDFLKKNGFNVHASSIGNVIGVKGSGSPVLLMASHLDTVPPELPFVEDDLNIYARGAVDCKSAWSSMLYSAAKFDWEGLFEETGGTGTIIILGVVEEEISTRGIKAFFRQNYKPDYIIFGEPTKNNRICYAYRGRIWFKADMVASRGHASSAWNYLNPIHPMLTFWNLVRGLGRNYEKPIKDNEKKHFHETTITLTQIHAGDLGNSTPERCSIAVDIRIPSETSIKSIVKSINDYKNQIENEYGKKVALEFKSKIPAVVTNPNNPLVSALRWSIFKTTREKAILLKKTGTTFMNIIYDHYKVPTVVYGPGDPKLEHSEKEFISKEEYLESINIYDRFFPKLFKMASRKRK